MMAKRGHGEGTVRYNADREYWEARFSYKDPNTGKAKRKKFTGAKQGEALSKGRKWLQEVANGLLPDAYKITVGQWLDTWLEEYVKPTKKPKTYEKYKSGVEQYIKPYIGNTPLSKVKAPDVQRLYNRLLKEGGKKKHGISCYTVHGVHVNLHAAFDQALKVGLVTRNIIEAADAPRIIRCEVKPMTAQQAQKLLAIAKETGAREYIAVLLALQTGMRKGEIFGLKWQDVDFDKMTISVQRALSTTGKAVYIDAPKTARSRRLISITPNLAKELKQYRRLQIEQKLAMGPNYDDQGFIIATKIGTPYHPNEFHKVYRKMLKAIKLEEFDFHVLRHTHASILFQQGVHPKVVQERLGHASINMTMDIYGHLMPGMQETAVQALNEVLCL